MSTHTDFKWLIPISFTPLSIFAHDHHPLHIKHPLSLELLNKCKLRDRTEKHDIRTISYLTAFGQSNQCILIPSFNECFYNIKILTIYMQFL